MASPVQDKWVARVLGVGALLGTAAPAPGTAGPQQGEPPRGEPMRGVVAFAKARLSWLAARQRLRSDIQRLRDGIEAEFATAPDALAILDAYDREVGPVLDGFDERLADKLDEAVNAEDERRRAGLVAEARAIIDGYDAQLAGSPLIAQLDGNPFLALDIRGSVGGTLVALRATVA